MTRRVGILGGTFDPIHVGHLDLATAAERALGLSSLTVIPSHVPPHRPTPAASPFHRFAMVSLAISGRTGWQASDVELLAAARSYTSATLERLHGQGYEPRELFFLIGADAFKDLGSWKDFPAILDKANFCVVRRSGFPLESIRTAVPLATERIRTVSSGPHFDRTSIFLIDAETADVSGTEVRDRLAHGDSIEGLVPASVGQHIAQHELYGFVPSIRRSDDGH